MLTCFPQIYDYGVIFVQKFESKVKESIIKERKYKFANDRLNIFL